MDAQHVVPLLLADLLDRDHFVIAGSGHQRLNRAELRLALRDRRLQLRAAHHVPLTRDVGITVLKIETRHPPPGSAKLPDDRGTDPAAGAGDERRPRSLAGLLHLVHKRSSGMRRPRCIWIDEEEALSGVTAASPATPRIPTMSRTPQRRTPEPYNSARGHAMLTISPMSQTAAM